MDQWKVQMFALVGVMVFHGVGVAFLGFYSPTFAVILFESTDDLKDFHGQLVSAMYVLGVLGSLLLFVGALGIAAIISNMVLFKFLFYLAIVIVSVLLVIFGSFTRAAVDLITTEFKNIWRPKMEKIKDGYQDVNADLEVHALQMFTPCCGLSGEVVYNMLPASCCMHDPDVIKDGKVDNAVVQTAPIKGKFCSLQKSKSLGRKGCDVADQFVKMGNIVSNASYWTTVYMIFMIVWMGFVIKSPMRIRPYHAEESQPGDQSKKPK